MEDERWTYEAAAACGFSGESAPVTIAVWDASEPASLVGLQSFQVGPSPTTPPTLSLSTPYLPLTFSITNSSAPLSTVEISSDLREWQAYIGLSTKLATIRVVDPSPGSIGARPGPFFFRLRVGYNAFPSLADWQRRNFKNYQFRFERVCFCRHFSLSGLVEVRDGRIASVTDAKADQVPVNLRCRARGEELPYLRWLTRKRF